MKLHVSVIVHHESEFFITDISNGDELTNPWQG